MSPRSVEQMQVLVVDDDAELADVVAEFLEREHDGISAMTAGGADEALELIDESPVDCIVSDYDMPGTNGLELLRAVRETHPDIPFVLFTGKGSEEIASEAISAGVTEYLQKGTATEQYTVLANRIERAVSERRAKVRQAETERRFATLVENLPGMAYRCRNEPGWPMESVSNGCEELTGYTADQLESGAVNWGEEILHPDDRDEMWDAVQRVLDGEETFQVTYRIRRADGEVRWCWERGQLVENSDHEEVLEGFITDITPRKRREQELQAEREFTESALNALDDMFFVVDAESGRFVRWNDHVPERTGYAESELATIQVIELIAPDHHRRVKEAIATTTDGTITVEADIVTATGTRIPHEFRGTVITDSDGDARLVGVGRDVTERQERETELQRYETVVQAVGDPVYALDEDGTITFVNDAMEEMTGYDAETMIGSHIRSIFGADGVDVGRDQIRLLLKDPERRATTFEVTVETREDDRIPCEVHIALLPTADGTFQGTAGTIRDIEERKEREERLEQFASVVSHDLRGPLNVILGRVDMLRESQDSDELETIADAATRMENLIEDLLTLARQGQTVGEREQVSLWSVVERAWQSVTASEATLESDVSATVEADPARLRELLENLFHNSVEHGADDVTITVDDLADRAGFYVADDGPGIPEEKRAAVFDHGYTTNNEGTGFGLTIVKRIADAHGWSVVVTESEDGGARFEFQTG
ncbi:PAS domain S-box protein [Salinibaculum rarum]|uniref:hybrid sensor histidine kinase/response regulator n=1 Tax=Salinibaculum rarum TaxID=3058903 RepID=UPI00265FF96B|nr:PAS domain S-box protein [Salinibaculum sp. KK48]